jgi:PKD repeat protein
MKYFFSYLLLWLFIQAQAQLHDNMWITSSGTTFYNIDFRENQPYLYLKSTGQYVGRSHSVFCNEEGDMLYYTYKSFRLLNKLDSLLDNGDSLNLGHYFNINHNPVQNGSFFLPAPGDSTRCYFVYVYPEYFEGVWPLPIKVQYALIDRTANNGLGKVTEKNVTILTGGLELNFNHAGAVRHANGRDWWILVPTRMEPKYYRILLTPDGFSAPEVQEIGFREPTTDPNKYFGYNLFSPDGTRYADIETREGTVQFYDFDRCTGLLSNPLLVSVPPTHPFEDFFYPSMGFSPTGKRFYLTYEINEGDFLVQFDLESNDIQNSWQVILACYLPVSQYECSVSQALLAPNGKIYLGSRYDTVAYLVINKPDELGMACDLKMGGLRFPTTSPYLEFSYFPNYRLGPIDGSPCDTLGINNNPVASFFWDATGLEVDFSNVSYYEPTDFSWDFGDPASAGANTSTEVNPNHPFSAPGVYEVCLTASNSYGSDTLCKLVTVDTLPAPPILPVAAFTWDAMELDVSFTNSSYNLPTSFLWNFGDPAGAGSDTSTAVNPTYAYPAPGSYHTCLIASNMNGSDTLCQLVVVDTLLDTTSMVVQLPHEIEITVMPNPTTGSIAIEMAKPLPSNIYWQLHDPLGRVVRQVAMLAGQQQLTLSLLDLPTGLYFWNATSEGQSIGQGKMVLMR